MLKIADNLEKNAEELATIESIDNGKPFGMAMYDIAFAKEIFRYYAGWTEKLHGSTVPMNGPYVSY